MYYGHANWGNFAEEIQNNLNNINTTNPHLNQEETDNSLKGWKRAITDAAVNHSPTKTRISEQK